MRVSKSGPELIYCAAPRGPLLLRRMMIPYRQKASTSCTSLPALILKKGYGYHNLQRYFLNL